MSTIITQHLFRVDLDSCPLEASLPRPLGHTDALADEIVLAVRRGMTPTSLSGMTVLATLTNANRQTLPLAGRIAGSSAIVTLTPDCYAVPGPFRLTVQLQSGDVRHTLLHLTGNLARTGTDQLLSSGDLLPTLPELLEDVADMHTATEAAHNAVVAVDEAIQRTNATVSAALGDVTEAMTDAAPAIVCDAGGTVTSVIDAAARPAVQLSSAIGAAQAGSGDPSPDNVRPISGWNAVSVTRTGKNLVDIPEFVDMDAANIRVATVDAFAAVRYKEATQYTISMKISTKDTTCTFGITVTYTDGSTGYHWIKTGSTYVPSVSTTAGKTVSSIKLSYDSIFVLSLSDVQLEEGAVATEYEPYQGVTLSAATPQAVYGGSLNWTTGVLTVTHVGKALRAADVSYKYGTSMTGWQTSCFVTTEDTSLAPGRLTSICSHFKNTHDTAYTAGSAKHGIYSDHPTLTRKYFAWGDPDATVTDFQAWLEEQYAAGTPVTVVYLLQEPHTIQLAPQQLDLLKGCNSLWSDAGDTALTFIADTRLYIDKVADVLFDMFFNTIG